MAGWRLLFLCVFLRKNRRLGFGWIFFLCGLAVFLLSGEVECGGPFFGAGFVSSFSHRVLTAFINKSTTEPI